MEGRRLYYDNLRKKYARNPEKVNSMEVETAKNKLEETLRQTDASMDAILCSDILFLQTYYLPYTRRSFMDTNVHQVIFLTTGGLKASKFCISKAIW